MQWRTVRVCPDALVMPGTAVEAQVGEQKFSPAVPVLYREISSSTGPLQEVTHCHMQRHGVCHHKYLVPQGCLCMCPNYKRSCLSYGRKGS